MDPITGGFIGWVCGKLGDKALKYLRGNDQLSKDIDKAVDIWAKSLPKDIFVVPQSLFGSYDYLTIQTERPKYYSLQQKLIKQDSLPSTDELLEVLLESWDHVKKKQIEPQPFYIPVSYTHLTLPTKRIV